MDEKSGISVRWISVMVYILLLIPVILIPLYTDLAEKTYGILISVYSIGGAAIIISTVMRPYLKRRKRVESVSSVDDDKPEEEVTTKEIYHEKVTSKIFVLALVIATLIIGMTTYFMPDSRSISYGLVAVLVILLVVGYFFRGLKVKCDNKNLSFNFGPIGKDVPLNKIKNIDVTNVRPLKDFMGWGHRIGPDGSIGYIAAGDKGVKIDLKNGKTYVITVNHPKRLINHVNKMKERYY
ncbi:MAG: hypothetical protein ACOC5D_01390 [Thermoplasmatota archaeon]